MALPVVLVPLFTGLAAWIGSFVAKIVSVETLKFLAWRAFILFLVFVCMPIVLFNVGVDLIFKLLEAAMEYTGGLEMESLTVELTGIAGYIGSQIYIAQAFGIYMAAIATRFVMGFIPFLR